MLQFQRYNQNPIISPNSNNEWEAKATFNPSVAKSNSYIYLLYRALSNPKNYHDNIMSISSIGCKVSTDGENFSDYGQLIKPEYDWEKFGCEDPRITKLGGKYYIFYTALSTYPFMPEGIKVGLAITENFEKIEKHLVTNFNSKAMTIFPERINGKIAGILTVDSDNPPSKIALCFFNNESEIWSKDYWNNWKDNIDSNILPLLKSKNDHVEIGTPPIKTKHGWLLFISYIKDYFSSSKKFNVEALLLNNKLDSILGRSDYSLLSPKADYEIKGNVPEVVFPTGATKQDGYIYLFYGASDNFCCKARIKTDDLINNLIKSKSINFIKSNKIEKSFQRYEKNPIIKPRPELNWENKATFNPAAFYKNGNVHIVYRAMSKNNTSVLGYALSKDGIHIHQRGLQPIYKPRENFEKKYKENVNSGCEDPRITKIKNTIYMCYTAYTGKGNTRVALTSIKQKDFLNQNWNWEKPVLITSPDEFNKDSCLFPEKINGKYVFLHRPKRSIYIDFVDNLNFSSNKWLSQKKIIISPRKEKWDNYKVGIGGPPIKTDKGWLLIYHGLSEPGKIYKLGLALLDLNHPEMVLKRSDVPIFEPEEFYEKKGLVNNVVFPCGNVLIDDEVFIYYGGADKYIGVAKISLNNLFNFLK